MAWNSLTKMQRKYRRTSCSIHSSYSGPVPQLALLPRKLAHVSMSWVTKLVFRHYFALVKRQSCDKKSWLHCGPTQSVRWPPPPNTTITPSTFAYLSTTIYNFHHRYPSFQVSGFRIVQKPSAFQSTALHSQRWNPDSAIGSSNLKILVWE